MDSSIFDHLPLLSKVSSSQRHITWFARPSKGLAWLQLSCAHAQVSSWYKEVPTYVSALKSFVAKQLFSSASHRGKMIMLGLTHTLLWMAKFRSGQKKPETKANKKTPNPNQKAN